MERDLREATEADPPIRGRFREEERRNKPPPFFLSSRYHRAAVIRRLRNLGLVTRPSTSRSSKLIGWSPDAEHQRSTLGNVSLARRTARLKSSARTLLLSSIGLSASLAAAAGSALLRQEICDSRSRQAPSIELSTRIDVGRTRARLPRGDLVTLSCRVPANHLAKWIHIVA